MLVYIAKLLNLKQTAEASLRRETSAVSIRYKWSGQRGSNPRPSAWEADALPTELCPLAGAYIFGGWNFVKHEIVIGISQSSAYHYSHSMVAGGLSLISNTTLFIPSTSLSIREDTVFRNE